MNHSEKSRIRAKETARERANRFMVESLNDPNPFKKPLPAEYVAGRPDD